METKTDITSLMSQSENHTDFRVTHQREPSVTHTEAEPETGGAVQVTQQASLHLILIPILPIHQVVVQSVEADLVALVLPHNHPTPHTPGTCTCTLYMPVSSIHTNMSRLKREYWAIKETRNIVHISVMQPVSFSSL